MMDKLVKLLLFILALFILGPIVIMIFYMLGHIWLDIVTTFLGQI